MKYTKFYYQHCGHIIIQLCKSLEILFIAGYISSVHHFPHTLAISLMFDFVVLSVLALVLFVSDYDLHGVIICCCFFLICKIYIYLLGVPALLIFPLNLWIIPTWSPSLILFSHLYEMTTKVIRHPASTSPANAREYYYVINNSFNVIRNGEIERKVLSVLLCSVDLVVL